MRLWFDDIRVAPPGWVWARTNDEAKVLLSGGKVVECSLDHDLGFHDVEIPDDPDELAELMFLKGQGEENGLDLVKWMCENNLVPQTIRIHSWNIEGRRQMADWLNDYGHDCEIREFNPKEWPDNGEANPYVHRSYGG